MAHKAPGKHYRKGITIFELTALFPDNATAERWFADQRWPEGNALSPLRVIECSIRHSAQDNALPLPRETVRETIQR